MVLSLPAWTPGAYEISNFVRWVIGLRRDAATASRSAGTRLDYDTWRIRPDGAKSVTVTLRLPRRFARQRDVVGAARFPAVQRDEPVPVSRGQLARLRGDRYRAHRVGLARGDEHDASGRVADVHGDELSRSRRHAVLRRQVRPRQRARRRQVGAAARRIRRDRSAGQVRRRRGTR